MIRSYLSSDAALEDGYPYLVIAALGDIARSKGMTIPYKLKILFVNCLFSSITCGTYFMTLAMFKATLNK